MGRRENSSDSSSGGQRGPPFWTSGPIPPARVSTYFVGHTDQRERVAKRWAQRAPARTVLLAPIGGGKRSLLNATLHDQKEVVRPLRIRVDRLLPQNDRGLARALVEVVNLVSPHPSLPRLARLLRYGPPEAPQEVIKDLTEPLSRVPQRPLVVFEGADQLARFKEETLAALDALASSSRAHFACLLEHVPPTLQEKLPTLMGPSGVRMTRLGALPRKEAEGFLERRFEQAGCSLEENALQLMVEYSGGNPANLQLLGARTHDVLLRNGKRKVTEEDVAEGLYLALESLPPEWTRPLAQLEGRLRDVFVALSLLDRPNVSEVGDRISLDAKNVCVMLGRLAQRGAPVEKVGRGKWRITQRLIAEWVRKEWAVAG